MKIKASISDGIVFLAVIFFAIILLKIDELLAKVRKVLR